MEWLPGMCEMYDEIQKTEGNFINTLINLLTFPKVHVVLSIYNSCIRAKITVSYRDAYQCTKLFL